MNFKESDFCTKIIRPYIKKNWAKWSSCLIEAKISSGKTLPFSKFEFQQLPSLYQSKYNYIFYKPTDAIQNRKPGDYFLLTQADGWIFILFEKNKTPRRSFHIINIDDVYKIKKDGRKSIHKNDCREITI